MGVTIRASVPRAVGRPVSVAAVTGDRERRRRPASPADVRLARLPVIALAGTVDVSRADTWSARRAGLAGLDALPAGRALWISPCRSVHTFGMRFALDLVWLDGEERVVRVDSGVVPRRVRTVLPARSVIETAAGNGELVADAWSARRSQ